MSDTTTLLQRRSSSLSTTPSADLDQSTQVDQQSGTTPDTSTATIPAHEHDPIYTHGHWMQDSRDLMWRYVLCNEPLRTHHDTNCGICGERSHSRSLHVDPVAPHLDSRCGHALVKKLADEHRLSSVIATNPHVRESERAVLYEHADGSWEGTGTNSHYDPRALSAVHDDARRVEFLTYREMRDYFKKKAAEKGLHVDDLTAPSNEILDFDEGSRRNEDTIPRWREAQRRREAKLREAFDLLGIRGQSGRYDRVLKERDRR